jgi:hypothetical protein
VAAAGSLKRRRRIGAAIALANATAATPLTNGRHLERAPAAEADRLLERSKGRRV